MQTYIYQFDTGYEGKEHRAMTVLDLDLKQWGVGVIRSLQGEESWVKMGKGCLAERIVNAHA